MTLTFKKAKSTRFIQYSEPNDEPIEHEQGKLRINSILSRFGYTPVVNTDKHEFALPTIHTELDGDKNYQLDVLMYNAKLKLMAVVELNGKYHYANKQKIARTKQKHDEIVDYFRNKRAIVVDKVEYEYIMARCAAFKTEEIIGKHAMTDGEILDRILW